jgi:hypothetical protein
MRCFGKEAIYDDGGDEVEDGEYDVGFVANVLEGWRGDFDDLFDLEV